MIKTSKSGLRSKKKVEAFIHNQENLSLLKFITCGSVDDGKSTLIGRILFESQALFDDQIIALKNDSKRHGTQGSNIDFALLVDGLSAEREQGITIDVAYRFFSTENRKFIVADTPGHEQYTRNMITGASNADVAVILVDARKGILEQTKRHSFITSIVGIKNVILAVNKMDLINYSQDRYMKIINEYKVFAKKLKFENIYNVPVSALHGDNILNQTKNLNWFKGPSLIALLETISFEDLEKSFIMPIQQVIRPNLDYRAYGGKILSGSIKLGDEVRCLPSGKISKIKSINIGSDSKKLAFKDQSISITLDSEIDVSRGDVICRNTSPIEVSSMFDVTLSWLSETSCYKGRRYIAKIGTQKISCLVTNIKHKYDINTLDQKPCKSLMLNDICNATISLNKDIPYTNFYENEALGKLILIDPVSNQTVAAAMINHSMRRSANIHKHDLSISRELREKANGHKGKLIWFTGLSGSGKSTIANALEIKLHEQNIKSYILDGDNVRHGLNSDLGFSNADRVENIRRVAEISKLMVDAGMVVLSSFISPFTSDREMVRDMFAKEDFIEVYLNTPLEVAESRDPKGLYKKARSGKIPNFTGINSPYEAPKNPEIEINTDKITIDESVNSILQLIEYNS